mgnify:CR=1 FL=1
MAATTGQYALQGGMGALGGAAAGLQTGLLFGAAGGPLGAGIGAGVGLIGGLVGTYLNAEAQEEQQAELERIEAEYDRAQALYNSKVAAAGAAAQESVRKGMAAKGAADQSAVQNSMDEAAMAADKAGLIGAEKASFIAEQRARVEGERSASSPEVFQQALGGARQEQAIGAQQAAVGLQAAFNEYSTDTQNVLGQETPNYAATIGEGIGHIGAASGAVLGAKGVGAFSGGEAAKTAAGAAGEVDEAARGGDQLALAIQESRTTGHMSDAQEAAFADLKSAAAAQEAASATTTGTTAATTADEFKLGPGPGEIGEGISSADRTKQLEGMQSELGTVSRDIPLGPAATIPYSETGLGSRGSGEDAAFQMAEELVGPGIGTPGPRLDEASDLDLSTFRTYQGLPYNPTPYLPLGYAEGGMAGQSGPEVAMLGEEGPELVLNAEQTQGLAQALGAPQQASSPAPRATSQAGSPTGSRGEALDPDELEAYLAELNSRFAGAL